MLNALRDLVGSDDGSSDEIESVRGGDNDALWVTCVAFSRVEEVVACGTSRGHVVLLSLPSLNVSAVIPLSSDNDNSSMKQRMKHERARMRAATADTSAEFNARAQLDGDDEAVDMASVLSHSPDNRF